MCILSMRKCNHLLELLYGEVLPLDLQSRNNALSPSLAVAQSWYLLYPLQSAVLQKKVLLKQRKSAKLCLFNKQIIGSPSPMVAIIQCSFQSVGISEKQFPSWASLQMCCCWPSYASHLSPGLTLADLICLCSPTVFLPSHLGHSPPFLIRA